MNTTFDVLVIVLSVLLGLFLILAIIAISFILKLVASIKRIVARGEQVIQSAESAAEMFKHAAGPLGAFKMLTHLVEMIAKAKRNKEK